VKKDLTEQGANLQRSKGEALTQNPNNKFMVVGLGASAGGIQALKEFFSRVSTDSGMAYVVILHMSPEHESKLAEILQVTCSLPVTQVSNREGIVPNHVYVIPPNQKLEITDGHLVLTTMIGIEERRSPVDLFFRTLAEARESEAVAVILSGTGANGSMGLKRIKEHGGVAFVQDLNEAEYSDMPRNAIATGMVDYILPVAQIPAKILSYKAHVGTVQIPEQPEETPKTDEQALVVTQLAQALDRLAAGDLTYRLQTAFPGEYEKLRALNPGIILVSVSGFGQYGPYTDRPAFDPLGQAMSGLMSLTGKPVGQPLGTASSVVDRYTALHATIGALAALRHRDRTGEGQLVDVCLLDSALTMVEIPTS